MVRFLTVILLISVSTSCALFKSKPQEPIVRVVTKKVPVFQCPNNFDDLKKPPRPVLLIENITSNTSDGYVAVFYKGSIKQLENYATELEEVIDGKNKVCKLPPSPLNITED